MKRPLIGIVGYRHDQSEFFGASTAYLEWISHFGEPRIIMPWEDVVKVDLLVLPGGLDLNPSSYLQTPSFKTSNTDVFKQHFYDYKLPAYIEQEIPIFGICLGFQQLVAYFGGQLTQDLLYHNYYSKPRGELVHECYVFQDNKPLIHKSKPVKVRVNSLHHQGVYNYDLPDCLEMTMGHSEERGVYIVEAMRHKTLPIVGVQYHPEETYCTFATELVNDLLNVSTIRGTVEI